ncbi:MAG: mechanosensitive ion channel [Gammaproteobacteria bacterium]|nr:mechanosensitive ion channel [Gammaproteobacteria bacterium]
MNRYIRYFVLFLFYAACLSIPAHAQKKEEAKDLSSLSSDVLLERARQAAESITAISARLSDLSGQEQETVREMDKKIVETEALKLPEPPAIGETPPDIEQAQIVVKAWDSLIQTREQLKSLLESQKTLAGQHREIALKLANETGLSAKARSGNSPLGEELQKRQTAGSLPADLESKQLKQLLKALAAGKQQALSEQSPQWRAKAGRDEVVIAETDKLLDDLAQQQKQAKAAQKQATLQLQEATQRAEWRKAFEERDLADLVSLFTTRQGDLNINAELLAEHIKAIAAKQKTVAAEETALETMSSPDAGEFAVEDETIESLRKARQDLLVAQANQKFREQRLEHMKTLETALQELIDQQTKETGEADKLLAEAAELDVLGEVIQTKSEADDAKDIAVPEAIAYSEARQQAVALRVRQEELNKQQTTHTQQLEKIKKELKESDLAIAEAKEAVESGEKSVEREKQWASFFSEAKTLSSEELLQNFQETTSGFAEVQKRVQAQAVELKKSREQVQKAADSLSANKDPVVLDNIQREKEFQQWHETEGLHLAPPKQQTPSKEKTEKKEVAEAAAAEGQADQAQPDKKKSVSRQRLEAITELRNHTVARYLTALEESGKLRQRLMTVLKAHEQKLTENLKVLEEALGIARRAWGGATMLQSRAGSGKIDAATLPDSLKKWRSREQVLTLQMQIKKLEEEFAAIGKQQTETDTASDVFIKPLQAWRDNLTRQIERLQERLTLEQSYTQPDVKSLGEFEQRQHKRKVKQRMQMDETLHEMILAVIVSRQIEETDQLLHGYYDRLLAREHKFNNLEARKRVTDSLITLVEGKRAVFEPLEKQIRAAFKASETRFDVETTKVKTVFFPAQTADLLAQLKERTGVSINTEKLPALPAGEDKQALYEAQVKLVRSLFEPWASSVGHGEWLKEILHERAELGGIHTEIDQLKDTVAILTGEQQEFQRQIVEMKNDIGVLRVDRLRELNLAALQTLGWLLLIPLIAFIAIRIVHFIGRRKIARASVRTDEETDKSTSKEREERVKILFNVFNTAWTILVIALAIIYMFEAVNVDVLPLLASAGVLGLAFAFGAQQLVRDFFSGFFILLENQFKRGDTVSINGVMGSVEKVSPRLTALRDFGGSIHYFPNGSISHVNNYMRGWAAITVEVPAPYSVPSDKMVACLTAVCEELRADKEISPKIRDTDVRAINDFNDYAVVYAVRIETTAGEQGGIGREFRRRTKLALDKSGIEMPQRIYKVKDES